MKIKIFAALVILMVTVVVIVGLYIAGSPIVERERRFDYQRVNDLVQISNAIDQHMEKTGKLPASLSELVKPEVARLYNVRSTVDPETSAPYQYEVNSDNVYTLCATFKHENFSRPQLYGWLDKVWGHPAGKKCFKLESKIKGSNKP